MADTFALALRHHQAGNLQLAEQLYRQILEADPNHADSYHLLGVVFYQTGRWDQAVKCIRRALTLQPYAAVFYINLGLAYEALGQMQEAVSSYEQALHLQPDLPDAHANLGNARLRQDQREQAVVHYQEALRLRPGYAEAHNGLGVALADLGKPDEAVAHLWKALQVKHDYPEAHNNLGRTLLNQGKVPEAVAHFRHALKSRPSFAEAHNNLGNALLEQDRPEEGAASYREALRINPALVAAHHGLGNALERLNKLDEAIDCYRQALRLNPSLAEAYGNLGNTLTRQNRLAEAIDCYREALQLKPDYAEAHYAFGNALLKQGLPEVALGRFQEALRFQPGLAKAQSNLLFCLNYHPGIEPDAVYAEHCRWGFERRQGKDPFLPHGNDTNPERPLRIGYVSPDFRYHALTRYLEPVLAHHDRQKFEVFCYAEVAHPDAVTARLQSLADGWRSTCRLEDAAVAEQIRADRIDILVDLAGHTADNRLGVFAHKPAPVQATWLGYMNTTGLSSVDYRLTDEVLDPPGRPVRDAEQLVRLRSGMCCFAPPLDAPAITALPAMRRGYITFGSLHSLFKLNSKVFDLWSQVLKSLPSARLLMFHDMLVAAEQERIRRQFNGRGISGERLDLRQGSPSWGYLGIYGEIDIGLDAFPYTGGVTTCESLWMGVPVLSLCSTRPAGRNSAAILARVGLAGWAVETPEQFLALARRLPEDLDRLAVLRAHLRDRMQATLCDAKRFTGDLEDAYRAMWRHWCAEQQHAPGDANVHANLGNTFLGEGKLDEAVAHYQQALQIRPETPEVHNNLGNALLRQHKLDEAAAHYRDALRLSPNFAEAHHGLGNVFERQNLVEDALRCYQEGLRLNPNLAEAHNNVGNVLTRQSQFDEAIGYFEQALRLKPDYVRAWNNRGTALKELGKFDEALACWEQALQRGAGYAETHFNRALLWLLLGSWAAGWPEYEWRGQTPEFPRREFQQPRWDGSNLKGRAILLYAEQGLGDTLQFIRYAPLVKQVGAQVIVECQTALVKVLASAPGVDRLVARGSALPPFDVQTPLLSLPGILHTSLDDVPATIPYLHADPKLVEFWQEELQSVTGFKVGIVWQGSPTYRQDRLRSVPLAQFNRLAKVPGVQLISLQKGPGINQLQELAGQFSVHELGATFDEANGAFMDTAAVLKNLDLVITSDTAVPHLAGALGVPVWLALPFVPDWRWLLERKDCPWYLTMRLFRQKQQGNWDDVFERIAQELGTLVPQRAAKA